MSSDTLKELLVFLKREAAGCTFQDAHQATIKELSLVLQNIGNSFDLDTQPRKTCCDMSEADGKELFARMYGFITNRPAAENDKDSEGVHMLAILALAEGLECLTLFENHPERQSSALNDIDRAIVTCRPSKPFLCWMHKVAEWIESRYPKTVVSKESREISESVPDDLPELHHPVKRYSVDDMDIFTFQSTIADTSSSQPFIIENAVSSWPALTCRKWSNLEYLREAVGHHRLVPVEIGSSYTQGDWTMKLLPFGEFLDSVIYPSANGHRSKGQTGYLAQHDLLSQAYRLKRDFWLPDYTQVETGRRLLDSKFYEADSDTLVNIWLGPKHTISPLHYDRYDNLFAQVFGFKYFRLFHPDQSSRLYPHDSGSQLENTSQVDIDSPDYERFPLFAQTSYLECMVRPGDLLYIPPHWWHYVRSLSASMSVSMWF